MTPSPTLPTTFKRDPKTGLIEGLEYPRLANGRIDWKSLIDPSHIVFNTKNEKTAAAITKAYGAPAETLVYADVAAKQPVDDRHILILLAGWQQVAELRGFTSSVPTLLQVDAGIVAVAHVITWIPNEEEPLGKTNGATADATLDNTGGFGYLAAMAGNRAFVRAVRQGLGINVLAFDEIAKKDDALPEAGVNNGSASRPAYALEPVAVLIKTASECGFSFAQIQKSAINHYKAAWPKDESGKEQPPYTSDPQTWTKFEDIPKLDCAGLIGAIKAAKAKAEERKKGQGAK